MRHSYQLSVNGELKEEIYMRQPEGYVVPGKEHMVCKLTLDDYMKQIEFSQSTTDPCVYIQDEKSSVNICCRLCR